MAGAIEHFTTNIIDFQVEQEEHNRSIYVLVPRSPAIRGSARDRGCLSAWLRFLCCDGMRGSCRRVNRVKAEQVVSLVSVARFGSVNRGNSGTDRDRPWDWVCWGAALHYASVSLLTEMWIKGKFRPVSSGQGLMETASMGRSVR